MVCRSRGIWFASSRSQLNVISLIIQQLRIFEKCNGWISDVEESRAALNILACSYACVYAHHHVYDLQWTRINERVHAVIIRKSQVSWLVQFWYCIFKTPVPPDIVQKYTYNTLYCYSRFGVLLFSTTDIDTSSHLLRSPHSTVAFPLANWQTTVKGIIGCIGWPWEHCVHNRSRETKPTRNRTMHTYSRTFTHL